MSGEPDAGDVTEDHLLFVVLDAVPDLPSGPALGIARAVLAALPALGYRKADPARVEAGQPQVVAYGVEVDGRLVSAGAGDRARAERWAESYGEGTVVPLVTLADALAHAEQQRQAAVGDGQVVDREQVITTTDPMPDAFTVVMVEPIREAFMAWVAARPYLRFFPIPHDADDLPCYGVGPTEEAMRLATRPDETREQS